MLVARFVLGCLSNADIDREESSLGEEDDSKTDRSRLETTQLRAIAIVWSCLQCICSVRAVPEVEDAIRADSG